MTEPMIGPVVLFEGPDEEDWEIAVMYEEEDSVIPRLEIKEPVTVTEFIKYVTKWMRNLSLDGHYSIDDQHWAADSVLSAMIHELGKVIGVDMQSLVDAYDSIDRWYP